MFTSQVVDSDSDSERSAAADACRSNRAEQAAAVCLSFHGRIISKVFIARFLARGVLIVVRRCSSAKRRAALTSMVDSDPRPARPGPPDATSCYEAGLSVLKSHFDSACIGICKQVLSKSEKRFVGTY